MQSVKRLHQVFVFRLTKRVPRPGKTLIWSSLGPMLAQTTTTRPSLPPVSVTTFNPTKRTFSPPRLLGSLVTRNPSNLVPRATTIMIRPPSRRKRLPRKRKPRLSHRSSSPNPFPAGIA
ncbi:hypothetical protein CPB85DRAFT_1338695 [Mucidula mucida]|nr:hypothetical protein CPB85DRAFT_1338695 [Mucidula mucida]